MKIRQTTRHGKRIWEIDAGIYEGRRRRFFRKTKKAADAKLAELEGDRKKAGRIWVNLDESKRAEVVAILGEIDDAGLTLRTVWERFQALGKPIKPTRLSDAIRECVADKQQANRRGKYLDSFLSYLEIFERGREAVFVHDLTGHDVREYVNNTATPASRQTRRARLFTFFEWAKRRRIVADNPVSELDRITVDYGVPDILTNSQAEDLMKAALSTDAGTLGELALMLFAGIRPGEVVRMKPADVDLTAKVARIDSHVAKGRQRRIVDLEPPAVAWMSKATEFPIKKNRRRRLEAVRKAAKLTDWPHDVLRHTAASHLFAKHGAAKASQLLGNSELILLRHYRELTSKDDNSEFWGILPSKK